MLLDKTNPSLILASRSASRQALLQRLSLPFKVCPADIDESPFSAELPHAYVLRVAIEKAQFVSTQFPDALILAADTIVAVGRRILRKAETPEEATAQLRMLSGRRHRVLTAVVCLFKGVLRHRISDTHVAFKALEASEIDIFVQSQQWREVAVYCHEGFAAAFIRRINGSPTGLSGLPLFHVYQLLKGHGFEIQQPLTSSL